jgi:hypothetical protein
MHILKRLEKNILSKDEIEKIIELDLNGYNIKSVPESIGQLTQLQHLNLESNKLKSVPESIGKLTQLQHLNLNYNKITSVPESIRQLTKLKKLFLYENQITSVPESIGQLTQLQDLVLSYNQITSVPNSIGQLTQLQYLSLGNNQITSIPESIGKLTQLHTLDLGRNQITNLPESIGQLTQLQYLNLSYNQITSIPASFGKLIRCRFFFANNEIINIPPNVRRLLQQQKTTQNIYSDAQNVHNHNIQESVRNSIFHLLDDKNISSNSYEHFLDDDLILPITKQLIMEYCNDPQLHSSLNITFKEIFDIVWNRIIKHEHNVEIKKILNEEMKSAECKCFTGRISRLVNVLNGYYDDIKIEIEENEQIGTIIGIMAQNYIKENGENYDADKLKDIIKKELMDRNLDKITISQWLEHVE